NKQTNVGCRRRLVGHRRSGAGGHGDECDDRGVGGAHGQGCVRRPLAVFYVFSLSSRFGCRWAVILSNSVEIYHIGTSSRNPLRWSRVCPVVSIPYLSLSQSHLLSVSADRTVCIRFGKVYDDVLPYWDSHPPRRSIGPADFILIRNPHVYGTVY